MSLLQNLKNYLETPEGQKSLDNFFDNLKKKEDRMDYYVQKFHSLEEKEKDRILNLIYTKYTSREYLDRECRLGREPRYYLGIYLVKYGRDFGKPLESKEKEYEPFSSEFYLVENKWAVGFVYGQGTMFIMSKI